MNKVGLQKDDFNVDKEEKKVVAKEKTYEKYRPEEITDELEAKVDGYRTDYVASLITVAGEIALDELLEDPDDTAMIESKMGKSAVSGRVSHTKEGSVSGRPYKNHGSIRMYSSTPATSISRGSIGKAQKQLRALAKKKLGG